MLSLFVVAGSAFVPPSSLPNVQRVAVSPAAEITMGANKGFNLFGKNPASPTKPKVSTKAKPLSPGSNYPSTKNIQTQSNGFGTFMQKFQTVDKKSKYGMPIFLPNGNINPAYLAAERKDAAEKKRKNTAATAAKVKKLISKKEFELADYVRKKIGEVGSGKDYYQSGR
jgi:hypothetical protein